MCFLLLIASMINIYVLFYAQQRILYAANEHDTNIVPWPESRSVSQYLRYFCTKLPKVCRSCVDQNLGLCCCFFFLTSEDQNSCRKLLACVTCCLPGRCLVQDDRQPATAKQNSAQYSTGSHFRCSSRLYLYSLATELKSPCN